jgi:hypothetical protein
MTTSSVCAKGRSGALRRALILAGAAMVLATSAAAQASDPVAALEQLKQGYALKQEGKCREAIPRFVESQRLDPQAKALLNLADCEDQLGDFVGAQTHAIAARSLATRQGNAELIDVADGRVAALDKRMPWLTIALARGAPAESVVTLDSSKLGAGSLGAVLAANPGMHVIVVRALGHAAKTFSVVLTEGAHITIEVAPGASLAAQAPRDGASPGDARKITTRTTVALGLGGAGVVGLVVGGIFGFVSKSTYEGALKSCDNGNPSACSDRGIHDGQTAHGQATMSTIGFVTGGVLLAGGAVLYLTAPKDGGASIRLTVGPSAFHVRGAW